VPGAGVLTQATSELVARAKAEGTSVMGALGAATAQVFRDLTGRPTARCFMEIYIGVREQAAKLGHPGGLTQSRPYLQYDGGT
jgi:hypothetical protein